MATYQGSPGTFLECQRTIFPVVKPELKTLEAWLDLLKEKEAQISKVFAKTYGADKVVSHLNNWKLFYIMSSEAFRYNSGNDWCVAHYTFQRNL